MANIFDITANGVLKYSSAALENSKVIAANQAVLYGFDGRNADGTNAKWIMVFDSATLPANGAIPVICIGVPPAGSGASASNGNFFYGDAIYGESFTKGIVIAASTTDLSSGLTVDTGSKTLFHVQYSNETGNL